MSNDMALAQISSATYADRFDDAYADYGLAAKEYYAAEKKAFNAACDCVKKAKSFEERKYWYDKMEHHAAALREHKIETVCVVGGLLLLGLLICRAG